MCSSRVSTNIVVHTEQQIMPQCVLLGLRDLVHVIKHNYKNYNGDISSEEDVEPLLVRSWIQHVYVLVIVWCSLV